MALIDLDSDIIETPISIRFGIPYSNEDGDYCEIKLDDDRACTRIAVIRLNMNELLNLLIQRTANGTGKIYLSNRIVKVHRTRRFKLICENRKEDLYNAIESWKTSNLEWTVDVPKMFNTSNYNHSTKKYTLVAHRYTDPEEMNDVTQTK